MFNSLEQSTVTGNLPSTRTRLALGAAAAESKKSSGSTLDEDGALEVGAVVGVLSKKSAGRAVELGTGTAGGGAAETALGAAGELLLGTGGGFLALT